MNDNSEVSQQILLVFLGKWYEEHTKIPSIMGRLENLNYRYDLIRRMPIYSKLFEESTAEEKEKLLETFAIAKAVVETVVQSQHILK